MKLRLLTILESVLASIERRVSAWRDEVSWRKLAATPPGPNPHTPGPCTWLLHEECTRIAADYSLTRKYVDQCPWTSLLPKKPWPDQLGKTVLDTPPPP